MGTLKQGILGGFSGKVGTVIGYTRNGMSYIRGLMTSHTDANTLAQQEQRAKFRLVVLFLRPLIGLLRTGFKKAGTNLSGFNAAVSYTLGNAVTGIFPDLTIDYPNLMVCQGNLPGALNAEALPGVAGKINFSWDDNSADFGAHATDKIVLVAYCATLNKFVSLIGDATRVTGALVMTLPDAFSGNTVQTYLGFCNAGMTEFSNGEFLAAVQVV